MVKRKLQELYDDYLFCKEQVVHKNVILGKSYRFIEFIESEDQQQWQDKRRENEPNS